MLPRASKLVGLLYALDASDGLDVATGVVTAKSGGGLGFGGLETLGYESPPRLQEAAVPTHKVGGGWPTKLLRFVHRG